MCRPTRLQRPSPSRRPAKRTRRNPPAPSSRLAPPADVGPDLVIDAAANRHAISPLIYGMNHYARHIRSGRAGDSPAARTLGRRRCHALQLAARRLQLRERLLLPDRPELNTGYSRRLGVNTMIERDLPRRHADDGDGAADRLDDASASMPAVSASPSTARNRRPIPTTPTAATASARRHDIIADPNDTSVPIGPDFVGVGALSGQPLRRRTSWRRHVLQPRQRAGALAVRPSRRPPRLSRLRRPGELGITYAATSRRSIRRPQIARAGRRQLDGVLLLAAGLAQRLEHGAGLRVLRQPRRPPRARRLPFIEWYLQQFAAASRSRTGGCSTTSTSTATRAGRCPVQAAGDTRSSRSPRLVARFWDPSTTSAATSTTSRFRAAHARLGRAQLPRDEDRDHRIQPGRLDTSTARLRRPTCSASSGAKDWTLRRSGHRPRRARPASSRSRSFATTTTEGAGSGTSACGRAATTSPALDVRRRASAGITR